MRMVRAVPEVAHPTIYQVCGNFIMAMVMVYLVDGLMFAHPSVFTFVYPSKYAVNFVQGQNFKRY